MSVLRLWASLLLCTFCNGITARVTTPCGNPVSPMRRPIRQRVVGGQTTTAESFPWTVVFLDALTNKIVCGGVILSENVVLTAAHCFSSRPQPYETFIYTGKNVLNEYNHWEQTLNPISIVNHEGFDSSSWVNDIALVKVRNNIRFNDGVKPVCLPNSSHILPVGTMSFLAGFGDTLGMGGADYHLNYIEVPVIDDEICSRHDWQGVDFIPEKAFCAGYADGGPDACTGDSGSGLVHQYSDGNFYVYGIASWGRGCGESRMPGVYTDVLRYIDWILQKLALM